MKNRVKLIGIIALVAVMAFALVFTACSDGGGSGGKTTTTGGSTGPQTVTYSGTADGSTYTLKITEDAESRAAYSPLKGDKYELTVGSKKSAGILALVSALVFTLQPSGTDAPTFTVTVTASGAITKMSGTITWSNGTTEPAPATLTGGSSGGTSGGVSGTYTYTDPDGFGSASITFSGGTSGTVNLTATITFFGPPMTEQARGTYTVSGNTITITITSNNSSDPFFFEVGDVSTFTIINANTIKDDEDGDYWYKK